MSVFNKVKEAILPNRAVKCRIYRGPFRGARIMANPQHSLRYLFGLYEHELNSWLEVAIARTSVLFDVGANHGYFSCGVQANWKRNEKSGVILAFEPEAEAFERLCASAVLNESPNIRFIPGQAFVGRSHGEGMVSLDQVLAERSTIEAQRPALVKIDVEGAEIEVLAGAERLVRKGNLFVVEAHSRELLDQVSRFFADRDHASETIYQRPLPLIGRERRDVENYWVVSSL